MDTKYKLSKYTIPSEFDGRFVLFNALSGGLIEIGKEHLKRFEELSLNVDKFCKEEPAFFKALVTARFIIPEEVDELDIIRYRSHRDTFLSSYYNLIINPTMNCNFSCWYCYEEHPQGRMSDEMMNRVAKHVETMLMERKISALALGWFGGEPLLFFDEVVVPLSKQLAEIAKNAKVEFTNNITTNGYLIYPDRINKLKEIGMKNYQITLDGARDLHNASRYLRGGGDTYDRIVENIRHLLDQDPDCSVTLRINYSDKVLPGMYEIAEEFPKRVRDRINIDFQRIWQTFMEESLLNNKLDIIVQDLRMKGYSIKSNTLNLYQGAKCYADRYRQAVVNYDGTVYKCTARDFKIENSDGILGDNGEIIWKTERIISRFASPRFDNPTCLECQLLPLCGGPCSQKIMDAGKENISDICPISSIELSVTDFIRSRFYDNNRETDSCAKP